MMGEMGVETPGGARRPAYGFLVFLAACSSGDISTDRIPCGPNGSCPSGYTCDVKSQLCMIGGGVAQDAPLVLDAPLAVVVDAPVLADARPDGRPDGRPDAAFPDAPPAPPVLTIDPPAQDFGTLALGSIEPALAFTVTNGG